MRKRLVRKTFDMIQEISESENKEVGIDSNWILSDICSKATTWLYPKLQAI